MEEDDTDRRDWMIKKAFLANMLSMKIKNQIYLRLQTEFTRLKIKNRFDILRFELPQLLETARDIEEVFERERNLSDDPPVMGGAGEKRPPKKQGKQPQKRKEKPANQQSKKQNPMPGGILPSGKCCGCNGKPHGPEKDGKPTNNREARQKSCPAWGKKCNTCQKEGHFTAVCKAEAQKKGGNGTEVQKEEPKEPQRKEIQGSGSLFQDQVMPHAWDRGTIWTGGVHLMTGPENSEPLIWADEQEDRTELEEEPRAGNA